MYNVRNTKKHRMLTREQDSKHKLTAYAINTRAKTSTMNRKVKITLPKIGKAGDQ